MAVSESPMALLRAGVDVAALGETLQRDGASAFVASWKDLMDRIATKAEALRRTA